MISAIHRFQSVSVQGKTMVFPDLLTANELLEDRLPVCDKVKNLLGIKSFWLYGVTGPKQSSETS